MKGTAVVQLEDKTHILYEGQSLRIMPGQKHRFSAPDASSVQLIEVSTPEIDDVVRIEDDWNRE
jgi:mannose-6-phosphate isomerase-like protein (cupin superfamily)